ncbi:MAG TPA: pilus assembly PilX N-terminal domain-containing protein [Pyrinomonadaceae bacterium]
MTFIPMTRFAFERRRDERGAALITTLLISTLIMIVGGALLLSTSLASGNAIDSTSELQAYYSAEAGVNAGLNVLRGNIDSITPGTRATFRAAVTNGTLSNWLNYGTTINGASAVSLNTDPVLGYSISVTDPDNLPIAKQPTRLLMHVTGYGPKGASKQMEVMVDRFVFDYSAIATLVLRGNDDNSSTMTFAIGQSNAKLYSGNDNAGSSSAIPVIGTTHTNDFNTAVTEVNNAKPNTVNGSQQVKQFANSDLPLFLQTADNARSFLNEQQAVAQRKGRYFGNSSGTFGSDASPQLTFVDGDCSLTGGAGLLIVTGTLTLSGTPSFNGLILVMGTGSVVRHGGGNGDMYGAFVVARFVRTWPSSENNQSHPFLTPSFDTSGGGNSTIGFDSAKIDSALSLAAPRVLAMREN